MAKRCSCTAKPVKGVAFWARARVKSSGAPLNIGGRFIVALMLLVVFFLFLNAAPQGGESRSTIELWHR